MRVLMFGWEYPPHISGGLGTACFGLSQSLAACNIDLIFVVPKLFGKEEGQVTLVNASEVIIPDKSTIENPIPVKKLVKSIRKQKNVSTLPQIIKRRTVNQITFVEVESSLMPYTTSATLEKTTTIEHWNYSLDKATTEVHSWTEEETETLETEEPLRGTQYTFSGTYGPRLLDEVAAYSNVGEQLAREYEYDVIHSHDWITFPAGIKAKSVSGKPFIIHVHATEFDRSGVCAGPVYEIEKQGMDAADKIIAVSQWTKDILIARYGIDGSKIEVVHNGIIANEENPVTGEPPLGSKVVTFLGRVTHQKGPAYFVEAARKVSEKFDDVHFVMAGSGDLLSQIINRVAELHLSTRFHFTGFLNKEWINKIWSMSSVYVMPSVSEPFGITPLEAIQAGVPVIVSNQSGVAEVMPHALKVDFWDTDALANAICSVLNYNSLSSMLKNRGEKEIKNLSWNKSAQKLITVYEELVNQG